LGSVHLAWRGIGRSLDENGVKRRISMSLGKKKRLITRSVIGLFLTLFGVVVVYTLVDMRQAKNMAVEACGRAAAGMSIGDLLPAFSNKDYRIIKSSDQIIIVPKKGMGRFNCTVSHDGRKITGSKASFID
jgi:hypothetical protein